MTVPKIAIWSAVGLAITLFAINRYTGSLEGRTLTGVVLVQDSDPKKQLPVANVQVGAPDLAPDKEGMSNSTGLFQLKLPPGVRPGQLVRLELRHRGFQPLDVTEPAGNRPHVFRLMPLPRSPLQDERDVKIAAIRVRYTVRAEATVNIGSAVKTFDIVNKGDIRCYGKAPCSPDGRWKAAIGGASLDAGDGNEFRNARIACIAGPCAYTRVENDGFSKGGRLIRATVRNWADTTSYLLAADVAHRMVRHETLQSYPVAYGRALSFILPPGAQGPSIQAEVDGEDIVYPLGPNLNLSWATCSIQSVMTGSKFYQCELKAGYSFP